MKRRIRRPTLQWKMNSGTLYLLLRGCNNSIWSGMRKPTNLEHITSAQPLRTDVMFSRFYCLVFTSVLQLKLMFHSWPQLCIKSGFFCFPDIWGLFDLLVSAQESLNSKQIYFPTILISPLSGLQSYSNRCQHTQTKALCRPSQSNTP